MIISGNGNPALNEVGWLTHTNIILSQIPELIGPALNEVVDVVLSGRETGWLSVISPD